jgi:tRNA G18 (ribose-2'-O)-methylase SpoU
MEKRPLRRSFLFCFCHNKYMATITGPDGMFMSQGHNENFYDGNETARASSGAMEETSYWEGPKALDTSDSQNQFAGHTAGAPASNGMGG